MPTAIQIREEIIKYVNRARLLGASRIRFSDLRRREGFISVLDNEFDAAVKMLLKKKLISGISEDSILL